MSSSIPVLTRNTYELILQHPNLTLGELAHVASKAWGWPVTDDWIAIRVRRLHHYDLLTRIRDGRHCLDRYRYTARTRPQFVEDAIQQGAM